MGGAGPPLQLRCWPVYNCWKRCTYSIHYSVCVFSVFYPIFFSSNNKCATITLYKGSSSKVQNQALAEEIYQHKDWVKSLASLAKGHIAGSITIISIITIVPDLILICCVEHIYAIGI